MEDSFKVVVPAEIQKSSDGSYRVRGLASTEVFDSQGELLLQSGLDLTPIDAQRGVLNWDHGKDPTDIVGILDGYTQTPKGLQIEGTLFSRHKKANAIKEIMESLSEKDKGRMGLSVEGEIIQRNVANPKIVERCRISAVALTMNPVNSHTHVELMKSFNTGKVMFDSTNKVPTDPQTPTYSSDQVVELLSKALSVGSGGTEAPNTRSGGDALAIEDLDKKLKKVTKLKKSEEIEAGLHDIVNKLTALYPYVLKEDLWLAVKDRLNTRFPNTE